MTAPDLPSPTHFQTVAKVGAIPEGGSLTVTLGDIVVAIFNDGGSYYAINDFCPHMGASLAEGHLEEGVVTCPWHAWRFCVRDGTWCDNPTIKTDAFEVRVVGEDIQVNVPPSEDESEAETPPKDTPTQE